MSLKFQKSSKKVPKKFQKFLTSIKSSQKSYFSCRTDFKWQLKIHRHQRLLISLYHRHQDHQINSAFPARTPLNLPKKSEILTFFGFLERRFGFLWSFSLGKASFDISHILTLEFSVFIVLTLSNVILKQYSSETFCYKGSIFSEFDFFGLGVVYIFYFTFLLENHNFYLLFLVQLQNRIILFWRFVKKFFITSVPYYQNFLSFLL